MTTPLDDALVDALAAVHGQCVPAALADAVKTDHPSCRALHVLKRLKALKLDGVLVERDRVSCTRDLREARLRPAIREGRFVALMDDVISATLRHPVQLSGTLSWSERKQSQLANVTRQARRALMAGNKADWVSVRRYLPPQVYREWFLNPLDEVALDALRPDLAEGVLAQLHIHTFWQADASASLRERMRSVYASDPLAFPHLAASVATDAVLCGDMRLAESAAVEAGDDWVDGLLYLAAGDAKKAARSYRKGLTAFRRATGDAAGLPRAPASYFLMLALVVDGTKTSERLAFKVFIDGRFSEEGARGSWLALGELLDRQPRSLGDLQAHPCGVLLECLVDWWHARVPDSARVAEAVELAVRCGWTDIARQLCEGPAAHGLVRLTEVTSTWERSLTALADIVGTQTVVKSAPEATKRLAWEVEVYGGELDLSPRLQSRAKGGWTKGRKVALSKLSPSIEGATTADAAIMASMQTRQESSWGGSQTHISWDPVSAWPALAAHPAVLDIHGNPLTIVLCAPRLVVERRDGGTQVTVSPRPDGRKVMVRAVGDGYEVTPFGPEQLRVAEVVGPGLVVPSQGKEALDVLLSASAHLFEQSASEDRGRVVDVEPILVVRLSPSGIGVRAELVLQPLGPTGPLLIPGEGAPVVLASIPSGAVRLHRNLTAEDDARERLLLLPGLIEAAWDGEAAFLDSPQACLALLESLKDEGIEAYWPDGAAFTFRRRVDSKDVRVAVREAGAWFEASGELAVDDDTVVSLKDLLMSVMNRSGRYVQLDDGTWLALTAQLRRDLDALARTAATSRTTVSVHGLASQALQSLAEHSATGAPDVLVAHIERLHTAPKHVDVPAALTATLRPYQRDAFAWMARLAHIGAGGILADDMGLGKTLTTLAMLVHRQSDGPALVVAPTSVAGNWQREAARFAPSLTTHLFRDASDRAALIASAGPTDVIITSYGLLVGESDLFTKKSWSTAVFDESQALKNPSTQRHKAAASVDGSLRLALTGTPIENHIGELHAQFAVVNAGMLGSATQFRKRFQKPVEDGDAAAARLLRQLVTPYLLRRTKEQVLDELPARTDIDLAVVLTEAEATLYEAQRIASLEEMERTERRSPMVVLKQLTRLRLLACSPSLVFPDRSEMGSKVMAFARLVDNLIECGRRALVFSQFVKHLGLLRRYLDSRGIRYEYLDGSTTGPKRDLAVETFQDGDAPLFLISTLAGGQGLNLTAADTVIHMDPWWNPAVEDQASDRAHRMGQQRPVTVYRLFAQGTVEEQILELHKTKRDLADALLEGSDAAGRLTTEQMMDMLRGTAQG